MANPAHEALLRQGIEEWNAWREQNGSVTPDLSGLRLPAAELEAADLSYTNLSNATLIRARLPGADLRHADLRGAQLHEVDLCDADLTRANLEHANLAGAKLRNARLLDANLHAAQVTVVDFRKADLTRVNLSKADLRESLGTGATLECADLTNTKLSQTNLQHCNLMGVRGLTSRQVESAYTDESTRFSGAGNGPNHVTPENLLQSLEAIKARVTGEAVSESEVAAYHVILDRLEAAGESAGDARILDRELVRPVTSWERTAGGEAFEADSGKWVDATVFRARLESVLTKLTRKTR